jgi:hypothetical protein
VAPGGGDRASGVLDEARVAIAAWLEVAPDEFDVEA